MKNQKFTNSQRIFPPQAKIPPKDVCHFHSQALSVRVPYRISGRIFLELGAFFLYFFFFFKLPSSLSARLASLA